MSLSDAPNFLPVVARLIEAQPGADTSSLIESTAGSKSAAYRILRFFKFHGAISYSGKLEVVDKKKVLQLAAGVRADRAVPDIIIQDGPPPSTAFRMLRSAGIGACFAFQSAANMHAFFEPSRETSFYVPTGYVTRAARVLRGHGTSPTHLHGARIDRIPSEPADEDSRRTTMTQTLIDLLSSPYAGAHAAFLQEVLSKRGVL